MASDTKTDEAPARHAVPLDYRQILEALADPVIAADRHNVIVYVNRTAEALLGWSAGELIGRSLAVIQPPRLRASHLVAFDRYLDTGRSQLLAHPIQVPALHRDGNEIEVELTVAHLPADGAELVVGSLRDLRQHIALERQLAMTRYLRASAEAAARLTSLLDFDAVVHAVVEMLVSEFDALLARVWLAEPNSQMLYLRAQAGPVPPPQASGDGQLHYEALPLWLREIVRGKADYISNDITADPRFDPVWSAREGVLAVGAFRLQIAGELRGIMVHFARTPFSGDLVEVLRSFAAIVTASLNDVQLFVREREARADAEAAQQRFAFLAEASRILTGTLDYESTLKNVAHLVVPFLADWCIVDIAGTDGVLRRLEVVHSDPERLQLARDYQKRVPPEAEQNSLATRVVQTGEAHLVREITDTMIEQGARDPDHLVLIRDLGLRSIISVPMVAHGRARGAITFVSAESGRRYGSTDLELAKDLGHRAAIAVDSAILYQELQEAIQIRDDFLSSVSHDLKNPIAAIKGRAQMLHRRAVKMGTEDANYFIQGLDNIDASSGRMARFIDDLVDVARLRVGEPLELARSRVDLIELLRQVIADQQGQTRRAVDLQIGSGIDVIDGNAPLVGRWDATRLERVFANLLSNAIKYSSSGSTVVVRVECERREDEAVAIVVVSDQGMGIPAADLPHIFERYHRGSNVTGKIEGTGVGLASAKQIVEQHGGTIWAESEEDKEATFTVRLPLG